MAADCRWCLSYRLEAGPHVENRVLVEVGEMAEVVCCAQRGLLRHASVTCCCVPPAPREADQTRVLGVYPAIF